MPTSNEAMKGVADASPAMARSQFKAPTYKNLRRHRPNIFCGYDRGGKRGEGGEGDDGETGEKVTKGTENEERVTDKEV